MHEELGCAEEIDVHDEQDRVLEPGLHGKRGCPC